MFYCFSNYHLDIVAADKCNYDSYTYLGLKCPFCSSIVFLHGSSTRMSNGRETAVRAYFAHSKIDPKLESPEEIEIALSCEARSRTSQGQELIDRLRAEAKGQRYIIYNKYLWDLFSSSRKITKSQIDNITADFGDNWCRSTTKLVRTVLRKEQKILARLIPELTATSQQTNAIKAFELVMDTEVAKQQVHKQSQYFAECDSLHHVRVSQEILDLLSTASGNYALEKILKATLLFIKNTTSQSPQTIKNYSPSELARMLTGMIAGTHWVSVINNRTKI
jgi:hypothetical protein